MTNNDYASKINNIMDKAKEDVRIQIDRAYQKGYADAKPELGKNAVDLAHEESDRAYQQGLEDAWEAAKKLVLLPNDGGLELETIYNIFGTSNFSVLNDVPVSEAIAKIKEYEEQQKQDAIQVGDEVFHIDENNPRVVVRITDQMSAVQITGNGKMAVNDVKELHRTGRHFPQIAEVLAEMRGEE